jgi:glutamate-1-semialdehyde 2,1-aminomutase
MTENGRERWKRAKQVIPGGTQLLSKQSEMFLPDQWPSYYSRAKGITLWGLDGTRYTDMSIMGVGACILGYADDDVNQAVHQAVDAGSMATLNSPEEVDLAELLLRLNPWAEMVRYARTGGEAMAIAVRIARAHTGRDTVAFCGYHGWHDWYLAANLADNRNLDGQLLPGLEPKGVPRGLIRTALPFNYNRLDELERIVEKNSVGVIVMEPVRHHDPDIGFLQGVRKLADETGAVLIFDEITSGWRMTTGGVHMLYNVIPDIAVYGKAMSNGYPMAAVVGRREVMESAQESFISSTYWTERIGPVASIATINKCIGQRVPDHLIAIGNQISQGWKKASDRCSLPIEVMGLPPLTTFRIEDPDSQILHTLFTQEMLGRGYLASKSVYTSFAHTAKDVEAYLSDVEEVFGIIRNGVDTGTIPSLLKSPIAHVGFKRLT